MNFAFIFSANVLVFALSYYLLSALQWYSYKFDRIIFHYARPSWHMLYFIIPLLSYWFLSSYDKIYFLVYLYFALLPSMIIWKKKLDKALVWTNRIKRFFLFLLLALLVQNAFFYLKGGYFSVLLPIVAALGASYFNESFLSLMYQKKAKEKLKKMKNLKIIAVTASFGKSSIKNFLFDLLEGEFICHKTPRSVNTLKGLILDINTSLRADTQIYIAEAGARLRGDIAQIAEFLHPHIAIIGEIGLQHVEYFKTLENIRSTKLELLNSNRLEHAFLHQSTQRTCLKNEEIYDQSLSDIRADLDGCKFSMQINGKNEEFFTPLLGAFNAENLAVCIKVALYLGLDLSRIKHKISNLKSVEHRLQRIDAGGKIILDDSFNGNFKGMKSSYFLASTHKGRKVLLTPGIAESSKEENERLALIINDIFDLVVITSPLNSDVFLKIIKKPELRFIKDKSKIEDFLAKNTHPNDLILFSNDAPSYM